MALAARVLPVCPPEKSVTTQDSNTAHEQAQLQAGTKRFQPSSPCCDTQRRAHRVTGGKDRAADPGLPMGWQVEEKGLPRSFQKTIPG